MPSTTNQNHFFDRDLQGSQIAENNVAFMVNKYQDQNIPLIGLYHTQSQTMTLFPCFRKRYMLVADREVKSDNILNIKYTAKIKNKQRVPLSNEEKVSLNSQKEEGYVFPPRLIYSPQNNNFISPHQYMLNLMQVPQNEIINYRGFACEPSRTVQYILVYKSGSLNSPRDENGNIIKRVFGAEPTSEIKNQIQKKFTMLALNGKEPIMSTPSHLFSGNNFNITSKANNNDKIESRSKLPELLILYRKTSKERDFKIAQAKTDEAKVLETELISQEETLKARIASAYGLKDTNNISVSETLFTQKKGISIALIMERKNAKDLLRSSPKALQDLSAAESEYIYRLAKGINLLNNVDMLKSFPVTAEAGKMLIKFYKKYNICTATQALHSSIHEYIDDINDNEGKSLKRIIEDIKYFISEGGDINSCFYLKPPLFMRYRMRPENHFKGDFIYHSKRWCLTKKETTALHEMCRYGESKVVQFMLENARADFTCTDGKGNTPLDLAHQSGDMKIVTMLDNCRKLPRAKL